jgi:hypothetical protein
MDHWWPPTVSMCDMNTASKEGCRFLWLCDLTLDPIALDRVDRNMILFERSLFVLDA